MKSDIDYYKQFERYELGDDDTEHKIVQIPVSKLNSFIDRCSYLYRIRAENGDIIPYIPNQAQQILNDVYNEEFERSQKKYGYDHAKLIVLKSRQVGCTTDTALRYLDRMLHQDNCYGLVLAHVSDDTELIYDKYKIAYNHLPDYVELLDDKGNVLKEDGNSLIPFKPHKDSYSAKQLRFGNMTNSWLNVRTAGSGDNIGKGSSLNLFHASEAANYEHYSKVVNSANQMMSNTEMDKVAVTESTANGTSGIGEGFYNEWIRSTDRWNKFKNGDLKSHEGIRPVFIPWYIIDKYHRELENGEFINIDGIDFGSPEGKDEFLEREKILKEEYNVSDERLNWYRFVIIDQCSAKWEIAHRYFPTFPEDAFLSTNKTFFDSNKLFEIKGTYENKPPLLKRGYINEELEFQPNITGELLIKTRPDKDWFNRYIVSCDQSEGLEDGDYSSMSVFDRLEKTYVARWRGKVAEDVLAEEFMKLGYYYNTAFLIPERNRKTVINLIKPDGQIPYNGEMYAEYSTSGIPKWGWATYGGDNGGRKLMLDEQYAYLRDNGYDNILDLTAVEEYLAFVRNVTNSGRIKYEADSGKTDDIVISDALCTVADARYDAELAEYNDSKTDFVNIIDAPKKKLTGFKQSRIGN